MSVTKPYKHIVAGWLVDIVDAKSRMETYWFKTRELAREFYKRGVEMINA